MSTLQKIFQQLLENLIEGLKSTFKADIEEFTERLLRRVLRVVVLGGMGVTLLAAGSIFFLIGLVTYLSQFMFVGLAWGLIGLIAVLAGAVLLLLVRR